VDDVKIAKSARYAAHVEPDVEGEIIVTLVWMKRETG
jgi:hypothetical protein